MIRAMKVRATVLGIVLLACAAALPATAAHREPLLFQMKRDDLRIKLYVLHDEVVRVHVGARENCRRSGASGFLKFDLFPSEAFAIADDGSIRRRIAFDDARGNGVVVLQGDVGRRSIIGAFSFYNRDDRSCGTRQPGDRRVVFIARRRG